jgi:hypothetical protein
MTRRLLLSMAGALVCIAWAGLTAWAHLQRPAIDAAHLARQREFSEHTFGPGRRTAGVIDHIRRELVEIEASPADLSEWVDVMILALDGAWRAGHEPQEIIDAIKAKQARNEARRWPDWRTEPEGRAIEHVRRPSPGSSRKLGCSVLMARMQDADREAMWRTYGWR